MPDVVVVGAGAAGTMAAIFASADGAQTTLLERTSDGGRKILISGGGRCNILPARLDESRFVTDSPAHLVRRMARSWPLREQVAFFERELGIPLVEETESAKLFPASQRARDVRDRLLNAARDRGVAVVMKTVVTAVRPDGGRWRIERDRGEPLGADAVIMATGGLSVPQTGSDGAGLRMVQQLGHLVHPTYPALTPLTADAGPFVHLAGVSLRVRLRARSGERKAASAGGFLFTHKGYSGPAVLDVSHVAVRSRGTASPARLDVQWTEFRDEEWDAVLRPRGSRGVVAVLAEHLPERLARTLVERAGIDAAQTLSTLERSARRRLVDSLVRVTLPWTGDEGYRKAEVTGGGVSLSEIDSRTMESRRLPGLFLCGEMLDAFGPIGGYNFYWAWATGRAAGMGAAAYAKRVTP
jgi:predicted Rossmann fold flavoprotein